MKNWYVFLACLFLSIRSFAQALPVVHGTVVNASSVAVSGQVVHLSDTLNGLLQYTATDTTNANGEYAFTIPLGVPVNSGMHVRTEKCGMVYQNNFAYQGANVISNFVVCGTTSNTISGTVKLATASGNPAYPATVYLIHKTMDTVTNAYQLTLLDTTATNTNGEYQFTGIIYGAGDLLVKSALTINNPDYSNYLPTYKENALMWNVALPVSFTAGANNIHMVAGTNPGGPGFIGGSVLQGANKTTGVGDPLGNRLILLTTLNDAGVGYTYSDANGLFAFSNLAYGTYKLFGDAWGKNNAVDTITLSATMPSVQVVFSENSTVNMPTGIGNTPAIVNVLVYPNPFSNSLTLSGLKHLKDKTVINIYNSLGALCIHQDIEASSNDLQLPTKQLSSGSYFLQLKNNQGHVIFNASLIKE